MPTGEIMVERAKKRVVRGNGELAGGEGKSKVRLGKRGDGAAECRRHGDSVGIITVHGMNTDL